MSSQKKKRNDNLTVVTAQLLRRVSDLEARVVALESGQPAPSQEDIESPPAPAPSNLPPGVRRGAA